MITRKLSHDSARRSTSGLTMIELLATVTIIGLLAGLLIPRLVASNDDAKKNACYGYKGDVEIQVQLFRRDKGAWPATDLSDMLPTSTPPEYDYFPAGLPVCPVDGSSYTIDPNTHEVVGHDHG